MIKIAPTLSMPRDAVTQTFGVVAQRGAGKTYLTAVLCEEFAEANLPFVVIDPMGVYWGLRSSADAKSEGLPIIILGGDHGDVPLESTSGKVIADWIVSERRPCVLDLSIFGKNQQRQFVTDFAEELYQRNRAPLHVILDEADMFAPQKPKGVERMLGAIEDLVRRGRARGIGLSLVTQRPAVLNKDVLTQVSTLIALRITGPQDRDAVEAWIKYHGERSKQLEVLSSLASLPIGDAWVWSPGWLEVLKRIHVRTRETFDSSATPKVGERLVEPKKLAPVDLDVLRERIAATIEKAKQTDPRELQRQIKAKDAEIRRLKTSPQAAPSSTMIEEQVKKALEAESAQWLKRLDRQAKEYEALLEDVSSVLSNIEELTQHDFGPQVEAIRKAAQQDGRVAPLKLKPAKNWPQPPAPKPSGVEEFGFQNVPPRQQQILDALRELESLGIDRPTRSTVAIFADRGTGRSNSYVNDLSHLKASRGLITSHNPGTVSLTAAGRALAREPRSLRTLDDFQTAWLSRVEPRKAKILRVLLRIYPSAIDREELSIESERGGGRSNSYVNDLSSMHSLGIIEYPERGKVAASKMLYPEGLE